MSTENMRKLMQLTEGLDDNRKNNYCPTCDGWGEYMPSQSSMGIDFDDIVPCPDCGPDDDYEPRLKTKDIKDRAFAIDESEDDAWEVEDFPVSESKGGNVRPVIRAVERVAEYYREESDYYDDEFSDSDDAEYFNLIVKLIKSKQPERAAYKLDNLDSIVQETMQGLLSDEEQIALHKFVTSYGHNGFEHWDDVYYGLQEAKDSPINEAPSRKDFRMVADLIAKIEDPELRRSSAEDHAKMFALQNPRFNKELFMKACNVSEQEAPELFPGTKDALSKLSIREDDPAEVPFEEGVKDFFKPTVQPYACSSCARKGRKKCARWCPQGKKGVGDDLFPDEANDEYYKELGEEFPAQGSEGECAWWAGCDNEATTTEPHPILGDVPICDRCVAKLRKIEGLDEANFYDIMKTNRDEDDDDHYVPRDRHAERPHTPGYDKLGSGAKAAADSRAKAFMFDEDDNAALRALQKGREDRKYDTPDHAGVGSGKTNSKHVEEDDSNERPYICVHAKHGKHECHANSSYGAAKKAAMHWGMRNTAGIDAHLADISHSTQFVGEDDDYGDIPSRRVDDEELTGVLLKKVDSALKYIALGMKEASERGSRGPLNTKQQVIKLRRKLKEIKARLERGQKLTFVYGKAQSADEMASTIADLSDNFDNVLFDTQDIVNLLYLHLNGRPVAIDETNDEYDPDTLECKHCGDYHCTSKFGGECPEIQMDMFPEDIKLESIVESVLGESQPKDYEMSDDEVEAEQEAEFERATIDKEIEDEELGLRFD